MPFRAHTWSTPAVNQSLMSYTNDKGAFSRLVQTIDENVKQDNPQVKTQRNYTCNWPPGRVHTVNPFPSDSITQPALYQATNTPVYTVTSLSKYRDALISKVKSICSPGKNKTPAPYIHKHNCKC